MPGFPEGGENVIWADEGSVGVPARSWGARAMDARAEGPKKAKGRASQEVSRNSQWTVTANAFRAKDGAFCFVTLEDLEMPACPVPQ